MEVERPTFKAVTPPPSPDRDEVDELLSSPPSQAKRTDSANAPKRKTSAASKSKASSAPARQTSAKATKPAKIPVRHISGRQPSSDAEKESNKRVKASEGKQKRKLEEKKYEIVQKVAPGPSDFQVAKTSSPERPLMLLDFGGAPRYSTPEPSASPTLATFPSPRAGEDNFQASFDAEEPIVPHTALSVQTPTDIIKEPIPRRLAHLPRDSSHHHSPSYDASDPYNSFSSQPTHHLPVASTSAFPTTFGSSQSSTVRSDLGVFRAQPVASTTYIPFSRERGHRGGFVPYNPSGFSGALTSWLDEVETERDQAIARAAKLDGLLLERNQVIGEQSKVIGEYSNSLTKAEARVEVLEEKIAQLERRNDVLEEIRRGLMSQRDERTPSSDKGQE